MPFFHFARHVFLSLTCLLTLASSVSASIDTGLTIAIDVGHSPSRHGATSARGIGEYTFNLRIAELLHAQLVDIGFENAFILTAKNPEMPLKPRTLTARIQQADLLISIHHDSVQPHYLSQWKYQDKMRHYSDKFEGFSLFVSMQNGDYEGSRQFADLLGEQFLASGLTPTLHHAEKIEGENRPLLDADKGIYLFNELAILRYADMAAVLVECGVIVNRQEEERLSSPYYQQTIVASILRAVLKYAQLKKTPGGTPSLPETLEVDSQQKQISSPQTTPAQPLPDTTE